MMLAVAASAGTVERWGCFEANAQATPTEGTPPLTVKFRGALRDIAIFGSRIGSRGALSLDAIRKQQQE